jgi:hypothetical protein
LRRRTVCCDEQRYENVWLKLLQRLAVAVRHSAFAVRAVPPLTRCILVLSLCPLCLCGEIPPSAFTVRRDLFWSSGHGWLYSQFISLQSRRFVLVRKCTFCH